MRANSRQEAEAGLRSKLCQIQELTALDDDGAASEIEQLEKTFSSADRLRRALIIGLLGLLSLSIFGWARSRQSSADPVPNGPPVKFRVMGQLDSATLKTAPASLLDYQDPSELKVYAVFPELPYEVESDLSSDGASFVLTVSFEGAARPRLMLVDVSLGKRRWTALADQPVPSSGDVQLGSIRVDLPPKDPLELAPAALPLATPLANGSPVEKKKTFSEEELKDVMRGGRHRKRKPG